MRRESAGLVKKVIPAGDKEVFRWMAERYGTEEAQCICSGDEVTVLNDQMEDCIKLFVAGSPWFGHDWYLDTLKVLYVQARCCDVGVSVVLFEQFEDILCLIGLIPCA